MSAPFPALGHVPYGQPDHPDIRRSRSVVYYLRANVVFVTSYCRPILTDTTLNFCQHLMLIACTDMAQTCVSSGRLRQQYPADPDGHRGGRATARHHCWNET